MAWLHRFHGFAARIVLPEEWNKICPSSHDDLCGIKEVEMGNTSMGAGTADRGKDK